MNLMRELTAERDTLQRKLNAVVKAIKAVEDSGWQQHDERYYDPNRDREKHVLDAIGEERDWRARPSGLGLPKPHMPKRHMNAAWRARISKARRAYWRKWRKENGKR